MWPRLCQLYVLSVLYTCLFCTLSITYQFEFKLWVQAPDGSVSASQAQHVAEVWPARLHCCLRVAKRCMSFGLVSKQDFGLLAACKFTSHHLNEQVVIAVVDHCSRPDIPSPTSLPQPPLRQHSAYLDLIQRCWATQHNMRPSLDTIIADLRSGLALSL